MGAATDEVTDYSLPCIDAGLQVSHCAEQRHGTALEGGVETMGVKVDVHRLTEYLISTIAQRCGFADHPCLTRAFKRALNVTPVEWRRTQL